MARSTGELDAVGVGQTDIDDGEIDMITFDDVACGGGGFGAGGVVAADLERLHQESQQTRIVFDDENGIGLVAVVLHDHTGTRVPCLQAARTWQRHGRNDVEQQYVAADDS